jgi:hypothetical protein
MNASKQIDNRIKELSDWRGKYVDRLRKIIHQAFPEIEEDWKWESPVFIHKGLVCSIGAFKDHIKLHFFKGAMIEDSEKLFNTGFEAKNTRGINFFENDTINEESLKSIIIKAIKINKK